MKGFPSTTEFRVLIKGRLHFNIEHQKRAQVALRLLVQSKGFRPSPLQPSSSIVEYCLLGEGEEFITVIKTVHGLSFDFVLENKLRDSHSIKSEEEDSTIHLHSDDDQSCCN